MAVGFREGFVEADGFRIRYMEAGEGPALVHLHGAGGLRLTPAHELLSRAYGSSPSRCRALAPRPRIRERATWPSWRKPWPPPPKPSASTAST